MTNPMFCIHCWNLHLYKYNLFATVSHKLLFKHNYVEFYDNDQWSAAYDYALCYINQNQTYILWNFCAPRSDNAICIGILFVHYNNVGYSATVCAEKFYQTRDGHRSHEFRPTPYRVKILDPNILYLNAN